MNRQSVGKGQKPKNSTDFSASDILQRKTLNRTDYGRPTVDTVSPSTQYFAKPGLSESGYHSNHDFSSIPVRLNLHNRIQAKLKIGRPDDKYEQEADRVAEQVMRMSEPRLSSPADYSSLPNSAIPRGKTIQRVCVSCSAEYKKAEDENRPVQPLNLCPKCQVQGQELLQTKPITSLIQAKTSTNVAPEVTPSISSGIQSLQGGGRPLSVPERSFFEPRFGADFSNVRIHNDTRAASVTRSVNARAFTLGHNVVFGAGEYSPDASSGRKLLAHELTHVLQQSSGQARQVQRSCSRNILAEGTCEHLACNSKWACTDNTMGVRCSEGTRNDFKKTKKKYRPLFTCDIKCDKNKSCADSDNWAAVPPASFNAWGCGSKFTVCANGKKKKAVVRDKSITRRSYEVSSGIQQALGIKVGSSFKGAIYKPGADQKIVDKDTCCKAVSDKSKGIVKPSSDKKEGTE